MLCDIEIVGISKFLNIKSTFMRCYKNDKLILLSKQVSLKLFEDKIDIYAMSQNR